MNDRRKAVVLPRQSALLSRVAEAARRLPGAELAEERLREAEQRLLCELKTRLQRIDAPLEPAQAAPDGAAQNLSARFRARMALADEQGAAGARAELYHRLLDSLVSDELRILGALSEGDPVAIVHVGQGPPVGPVTRRLASNLSQLGKSANLGLPEFCPRYIAHLRQLGLLDSLPEDPELDVRYQILEGDRIVRDLQKAHPRSASQRLRVLRRTLRISELGKAFWAACRAD